MPIRFAHRGASAIAPENTMPAFEAALGMKVDGLELDVHCSKDGQLVVIHDFDLVRVGTIATSSKSTPSNEKEKPTSKSTTSRRSKTAKEPEKESTNEPAKLGKISEYTAEELAQIDVGSWFDKKFKGVGVPTLVQVLDLVQNHSVGSDLAINVEIKSMDPLGGNQVEPLVELIQERGLYEQVIVSCMNPVTLIKTRWEDSEVRLGLLHRGTLPIYLQKAWMSSIIEPEALHPHHTVVDEAYMAFAKKHGCEVNTWTVNDAAEAKRLADLGVTAIISDAPDKLGL
ncbi:MAG: glycerophosphodiester phosphodiesterase family protein [Chloroflexota bacterium]